MHCKHGLVPSTIIVYGNNFSVDGIYSFYTELHY